MHFCTCVIALANDPQQTVFRNMRHPISWPELDVLQVVHGEGSVMTVRPFVQVDQTAVDERRRLSLIYGREIVEVGNQQISAVFPGRIPNMSMEAPDITVAVGSLWYNPLTGREEIIRDDGSSEPTPKRPLVIDEFNAVSPGPRAVEVVGDPRPDPTERRSSTRSSSSRSAQKYDDTSSSPFST